MTPIRIVHSKCLKHTIKFLSHCKDPKLSRYIISTSRGNLVKAIPNSAYNTLHGDVKLSRTQKRKLVEARQIINFIVDKEKPIDQKRRVLSQEGGLSILPIILSTVLTSLGSALFENIIK